MSNLDAVDAALDGLGCCKLNPDCIDEDALIVRDRKGYCREHATEYLMAYEVGYLVDGFAYSCGCGEQHLTAQGAVRCRKCRQYLMDEDYATRKVIDLRTGWEVA